MKLGNYQSHGNHKRSLLARNLSNPLPPASLFHGNLAWERGGEGYRRRERERDRRRKGGRRQGGKFRDEKQLEKFLRDPNEGRKWRRGWWSSHLCARDPLPLPVWDRKRGDVLDILFLFFPFFPFLFFHYWSARIFSGFFFIRIRNWKELKFNLICQEFWSCITKDFRFRIDFPFF